MPPKSKRSKAGSKKQLQAQAPETADDFLAAGVEFEEAGEKWRAGDTAKAARFFGRALDNYGIALDRFPQSFDLAYNRARVQYSITQHASLVAQFPDSYDLLLQKSLEFHLQALALDDKNIDVLFNAAQVHSSIAELIQERKGPERQAVEHYETSLNLFMQCLARQEELFAQQKEQSVSLDDLQDSGVPLGSSDDDLNDTEDVPPEEQWATVIEPVTVQALLDTVEEALEALGHLASFVEESTAQTLDRIEQKTDELIHEKVPAYLNESIETHNDADDDADGCRVAALKCKSSIFEAAFRLTTNVPVYDQRIKDLFKDVSTNLAALPVAYLVTYAQSLFDLAIASSEMSGTSNLSWNRLNTALDVFSEAVKRPMKEDLAQIHVHRGDAELVRYRLTMHEDLAPALKTMQVQRTVLQNAQTYYKGAARVAAVSKARDTENNHIEAVVKLAVTSFIGNGTRDAFLNALSSSISLEDIRHQLQDMVEESLITTAEEAQLASFLSV